MSTTQNESRKTSRNYEIVPRPSALGGGWQLILLENDEEAGGGVFPVCEEPPQVGINWWNSLPVEKRSYWMVKAASAIPADARHAYLLTMAYGDAMNTGEDWLGNP